MKPTHRLLLTALTTGLLFGCGGNGKNPSGIGGNVVPLSGGISTVVRTDTPTVPSTPVGTAGTPTSYTTTVNGQTRTVQIAATPSGATAGTPIAVIPDNIPIIQGSFTRAPGDIEITFTGTDDTETITTKYSNIVSSVNGSLVLTHPIGLLPGTYRGTVEGPIYIQGSGTKVLTVGSISFEFKVTSTGACSAPKTISGTLPMNGGSTNDPKIAVTSKADRAFVGGKAYLYIRLSAQTTMAQDGRYALVGTEAQFTFRSLNGGFTVPSTGVEDVYFVSLPPLN